MRLSTWIQIILAASTILTSFAQTPPRTNTGSIVGYVREIGSAVPVKGAYAFVSIEKENRSIGSNTDAFGRFELSGVPAGQYRLSLYPPRHGAPLGGKFVNVKPSETTRVEFEVHLYAELAGRVIDDDGRPLKNHNVWLVAREYANGRLGYLFTSLARTDEQGNFLFDHVPSGRGYLVMAQRNLDEFEPISNISTAIKARERTYYQTYYPNATQIEAAQPIVLNPHERREGIEIRVPVSQNYCIAGTVERDGHPAALPLQISEEEPRVEISEMGSAIIRAPSTTTGPDGKFRICDLHPGKYELVVSNVGLSAKMEPFYGARSVTITNDDLDDIHVAAGQRMNLSVEVAWDTAPPDGAPPVSAFVSLPPTDFHINMLESDSRRLQRQRVSIPGQVSFTNLLMTEYRVRARLEAPNLYVKDISYGSASVIYRPFQLGDAIGDTSVRVTVGRDGGFISTKVVDRENRPVDSINVIVVPADVIDPGQLQAMMITGETNAEGLFASPCLAPGKYYVLATKTMISAIPEVIDKLFYAQSKAREVMVTANGSVNISLTPTPLD